MNSAKYLWGKSSDDSNKWLPIWMHLCDTYETAGWVWDNLVPDLHKDIFRDDLDLSDAECKTLLKVLGGLHDVGKSSPDFSGMNNKTPQTNRLYERMVEHGCKYQSFINRHIASGGNHIRHEIFSALMVSNFFIEVHPLENKKQINVIRSVLSPINGHHGYYETLSSFKTAVKKVDSHWQESARELFDLIMNEDPENWRVVHKILNMGSSWRTQILLTGWVSCADWIASGFDLIDFDEIPEVSWENYGSRFDEQLASANQQSSTRNPQDRGIWVNTDPVKFDSTKIPLIDDFNQLFRDRFKKGKDFALRPAQRKFLEVLADASEPSDIFILEAPMGEGKTEAALLGAEILMRRTGKTGIFFGLPTMATGEALYKRFVPYLEELLDATQQTSAHNLVHSKSKLSDNFHVNKEKAKDNDTKVSGIISSGWYGEGRHLPHLLPFVVGTVDRYLMMSLKARYFYWSHLGFSQKVVIIDEVHSVDAHMEEYLLSSLRASGFYDNPVILLSATLPQNRRELFLEAYRSGQKLRKGIA